MKVTELLEGISNPKRRNRLRHVGPRWQGSEEIEKGLRIAVDDKTREKLRERIAQLLKLKEGKHGVVYTAPEQARTFPCSIRIVTREFERMDRDSLVGGTWEKICRAAVKRAFKEALKLEVGIKLEKDRDANGLRYVDLEVGWTADEK